MRKTLIALAAAISMAAPFAPAQAGGLTPAQLVEAGWTCFDAGALGVHCAPPKKWPPNDPAVQLLYFFDLHDPNSEVAGFSGTETLIRSDIYKGQPCPTEDQDEYTDLGFLGLDYFACHRR